MKVKCINEAEANRKIVYGTCYFVEDDGKYYHVYHLNGKEKGEYIGDYYKLRFEEVKEMTLVEKVMEHLGVENGGEFNINSGWYNPYNPYTFRDNKIYDRDNTLATGVLGKLVIGTYTIEKIHKKSEQQLAIERAEQKLKEAQEELQKAKEM